MRQALSAAHLLQARRALPGARRASPDRRRVHRPRDGRPLLGARAAPDGRGQGGLEISGRQETLARISYQRFFRRYLQLAGMTGTAREVAGELWAVYRLNTVAHSHQPSAQRRSSMATSSTRRRGEVAGDRRSGCAQLHADAAARSLSARDRWRIASTFASCSTKAGSGTAC